MKLNSKLTSRIRSIFAAVFGFSIVGGAVTVQAQAQIPSTSSGQDKPNIVLVFMDNFGWGEPGFNGGGIIRGAETPRHLDSLQSHADFAPANPQRWWTSNPTDPDST